MDIELLGYLHAFWISKLHIKVVINLYRDLHVIRRVHAEISLAVNALLPIALQVSIASALEASLLAVQTLGPGVTPGDVLAVSDLVIAHPDIFSFSTHITTL